MPQKNNKILTTVGMMTGTSFDGIDAAIIKTDGCKIYEQGENASIKYDNSFREEVRALLRENIKLKFLLEISNEIAWKHSDLFEALLEKAGIEAKDVDLIGFHGQTIYHDPASYLSMQIGNAALLSELTGVSVISDFRSRDIAAGGQGAPLVPLFHQALYRKFLPKPVAILNIGGVSNITYLGEKDDEIVAFDCGPGCALIDDFAYAHFGNNFDHEGNFARHGRLDEKMLGVLMENRYFSEAAPKSLDRNRFKDAIQKVACLPKEDALTTLTYFTAEAIHSSVKLLPSAPKEWLICGGGRHNKFLIETLKNKYGLNIRLIESGDYIEAQAFGFLAARSYYQLPLSFPTTTGIAQPISGGALYRSS